MSPELSARDRRFSVDEEAQGDLISHDDNHANAHLNSSGISRDEAEKVAVEEHHGEGALVEGEEDAVIY